MILSFIRPLLKNIQPAANRKARRLFSLLEILCVFALLALSSSLIGIRLAPLLEKKRFHTAFERLETELLGIYHFAFSMQSDWVVTVEKRGDAICFEGVSSESKKSYRASWKAPFDFSWNQELVSGMRFHFSSTGMIVPQGEIGAVGKRESRYKHVLDILDLSIEPQKS